ncbi:multidrug effflux MFS transporter [Sanguibacter suaedae]|uniref:Multidrug effflux MFS transporter n=1 Tax=Sanguibacter suaedae TaxID=2795737 RepID=A0A934MC70_9MICO|nr:multidrug effflux MFS transporter [Sanguibacter suaedae]MBI9113594.1 multidrug effflux MFS transporter [Sanguibacter suaedae]
MDLSPGGASRPERPAADPAVLGDPASKRIPVGFVLLLSALVALGPLTIDLYLAAFPQITDDLGTTEPRVQLTLTATLAGLAIGQLLIGSVSDAIGRRRPLLVSLAAYVVVTAAIVMVDGIVWFTALRFVQGLTAAAGMVLAMAIVRDNYSGFRVGKVIARLMLVVGVAPILAPTIGSQLLLLGSWRLMFVVLAVMGALLLLLATLRLQESLPVERRRAGGGGAALRSYAGLLRDWPFMGVALLSGFYMAAMFTYVSSSSFVFQDGFGLSAQEFGLVFGAGAVAVTAGSQINGALVGRVTPERILSVAIPAGVVLSAALLVTAVVTAGSPGGLWPIVVLLVLTLSTAGFVMPAAPAIALEHNGHRAGSAAALLGAMQFGIGAGIAPVTGLLGGDPATTMAGVMFAVVSIAGLLFIAVGRAERRRAAAGTSGSGDEAEAVAVAGTPATATGAATTTEAELSGAGAPAAVGSAGADREGARPVG